MDDLLAAAGGRSVLLITHRREGSTWSTGSSVSNARDD